MTAAYYVTMAVTESLWTCISALLRQTTNSLVIVRTKWEAYIKSLAQCLSKKIKNPTENRCPVSKKLCSSSSQAGRQAHELWIRSSSTKERCFASFPKNHPHLLLPLSHLPNSVVQGQRLLPQYLSPDPALWQQQGQGEADPPPLPPQLS